MTAPCHLFCSRKLLRPFYFPKMLTKLHPSKVQITSYVSTSSATYFTLPVKPLCFRYPSLLGPLQSSSPSGRGLWLPEVSSPEIIISRSSLLNPSDTFLSDTFLFQDRKIISFPTTRKKTSTWLFILRPLSPKVFFVSSPQFPGR